MTKAGKTEPTKGSKIQDFLVIGSSREKQKESLQHEWQTQRRMNQRRKSEHTYVRSKGTKWADQGKRQKRVKNVALLAFVGGVARDGTRPPEFKKRSAKDRGKRQKQLKTDGALAVFVGGVARNGTRPPAFEERAAANNGKRQKRLKKF